MAAIQVDIIQGSPEWHLRRGKHACASDIAAILEEETAYKTMRDVWFEKSGFGEPEDEDKAFIFARGHEVEAEIRQIFSKHTKIEVKPTCFENGIFFASLDGYDKALGILEVKLVGKEVLKSIADGILPAHHRIQVQAQLYTSESDKAFYAARAPKVKDPVVVEVGRNEKFIKQMVKKVEAFWETVQSGKVPPLSAADTLFITDPKQVELFNRLKALKTQKDSLDAEYDEIDKLVRALAKHPRVKCGDITISETTRAGSIDYLKIPEVSVLGEEYLETFRKKASTFKTIRFGKGV